jgi:hypothetical protein
MPWLIEKIRYDELVLVDRFEAKAEVIANLGVVFYIDDQLEMLKKIHASVNVMLFRNTGNFDFSGIFGLGTKTRKHPEEPIETTKSKIVAS